MSRRKTPLTVEAKAAQLRRLHGQIGALKRASAPDYDGRKATAAATRGRQAALERAVDPDGVLPEAERLAKAARLRQQQLVEGRGRKLRRTPVQKE
jgi:hypothetical protein